MIWEYMLTLSGGNGKIDKDRTFLDGEELLATKNL